MERWGDRQRLTCERLVVEPSEHLLLASDIATSPRRPLDDLLRMRHKTIGCRLSDYEGLASTLQRDHERFSESVFQPIYFFAKIANKEEALSEEKLALPLPPPFVFLRTMFHRYLALNFASIILFYKYIPPMLHSFSERCQITATTAEGSRDIHVSENATQSQIGTHTNTEGI